MEIQQVHKTRRIDLRFIGSIALAIAIIAATAIAATTWERVRVKPETRTVQITGSAKKRIVSDLIQWTANLESSALERVAAYKALHDQAKRAQEFLEQRGVPKAEIWASSVAISEVFDTEYEGVGENRVAKQIFKGYIARQSLIVRSTNVELVEKMSREITELLEQGITIASGAPEYFYTKLGEVKIEMLAEASKDARTRAENMVNSAGGSVEGGTKLGKLINADMGVININPANATQGTWDGNNDTTSLEKDIITIVHATYELD